MKAAIYARVSTEKQGRDQTIDSQLEALRGWATAHGHELKDDHVYIDEGYSGSRLDRPALDRLRDAAREGEFDVLGVYSPDRLARRYAYQVLLLEEFRKAACDVEFIERPISDDPHDQLLLQIQGADRRVRAGGARRAVPPRQAPEGPGRPLDRRPGPLRLPLRPQAGRRPGAPGDRRGRGRGGADALPLADRRADDRPPDPQAAGRRALAAPQRQAALVQRRRASDPLRPALHRHGLRQPARASSAPRSPGPPAPGRACRPAARTAPREEWIPIPVPAIIDESTYQDASRQLARNSALSFRNNTRNDYLLRCLLTCRTCGLAMCGVTTQRRPGRAASASVLHVPRQGHPRPGPAHAAARRPRPKVEELDAAVWDHVKRLLDDPATLAAQFEERARQADALDADARRRGPEVGGPAASARPRGATAARRLPGRGDRPRRTQGSAANRSRAARSPHDCNATRSNGCAAERQTAKEVWADLDGVLPSGCGRGSTRRRWPSGSGSCSCSSTASSWGRTRWRSAT